MFPDELFQAPRHWVKSAYHNLVYFNEADKGGHFAAWEEPRAVRERDAGGVPILPVTPMVLHGCHADSAHHPRTI